LKTDLLIEMTGQQKMLLERNSHGQPSLSIYWRCQNVVVTDGHISKIRQFLDWHENFKVRLEAVQGISYPLQRIAANAYVTIVKDDFVDYNFDALYNKYANCFADTVLLAIGNNEGEGNGFYLQVPYYMADMYSLVKLSSIIQSIVCADTLMEEPPISYTQYVGWQQELHAEVPPEIKDWQAKQLVETFQQAVLPVQQESYDAGNGYGFTENKYIDSAIVDKIKALSVKCNVDVSIVWQTIFALVLKHVTDSDNVSYQALLKGRVYDELLGTFGAIDQYAPFTVRCDEADTLEGLLALVHKTNENLHSVAEYFDYDFAKRFDVGSNRYALQYIELPDFSLSYAAHIAVASGSQLQLDVVDMDGGTGLKWVYAKRYFDTAAVQLIDDVLQRMLMVFVQNGEGILDKNNLTRDVHSNNSIVADVQLPDFIELFKHNCKVNADKVAVVDGNVSITYDQLNQASTKIAGSLITEYGIGTNDIVAICCDRSANVVVLILAVLKAGGAFLPIDNSLPRKRITAILENAKPKLLVEDTISQEDVKTVSINQLFKSTDIVSPVVLPAIQEGQLAYVIYTSGTTGVPKGCMLSRRNLAHYIAWCKSSYFADGISGNIGWFTPLSFDLTITSIFSPLALGKSLTVLDGTLSIDEILVQCFTGNWSIDTVKLTPSHINLLTTLPIAAATLRSAIVGGEALLPHHVDILKAICPDILIYNEYGPTEATVGCVVKTIKDKHERITIGRPIDRMDAFVCNNTGIPLLPGVSGELYLLGDGIAQGYLTDKTLTDKRFVRHDVLGPGVAYRTGDIVRVLPNGEFDYIGRVDEQVKIRGYRIELQEVMQSLKMINGITDAYVCTLGSDGNKELAAFYVCSNNITEQAIVDELKLQLPQYMIPASFYKVSSIPLTVNGKVDQVKLLSHELTITLNEVKHEPPANDTEKAIAGYWSELLDVENIGRNDDFFKLGGQSIKAAQLAARLRKEFSGNITLKDIFDNSVLCKLADVVAKSQTVLFEDPALLGMQTDYEVSPAQWQIWTAHSMRQSSTAYNMPAAYKITGALSLQFFKESFRLLIAEFEILRTSFQLKEDGLGQVVHSDVDFACNYLDISLTDVTDADVQKLCNDHAQLHIDLSGYPLYRASLIKTGEQSYLFLFNIHHILIDGLSEQVLMERVLSNYQLLCGNRSIDNGKAIYQYKEYAAWQNKLHRNEAYAGAKKYWLEQLVGPLPKLQLTSPGKSYAQRKYASDSLKCTLPVALTKGLTGYALEKNVSLFSVLISLINVLLYRYTGADDIIIGVPVNNRQHGFFEKQIGIFLNTILIRSNVNPGATIDEFVADVRGRLVSGIDNSSYPYELLAKEIYDRDAESAATPLFNVLVNLQEREYGSAFEFDGVRFEKLQGKNIESKVDLAFNFSLVKDELQLEIDYCVDLYTQVFVERMFGHIESLASHFIVAERYMVGNVPMLNTSEIVQLNTLGAGPVKHSSDETIYSMFKKVVQVNGDKISVVGNGAKVSYRELDLKAQALAHYLITHHNVEAGQAIPVLAKRNIETIEALLALQLCNAIYIPIDASYPEQRVRSIIAEAESSIVLNATGDSINIDGLDNISIAGLQLNIGESFESRCMPDSAAYRIYTSGSTGKPKGVTISHRGFVNMILAQIGGFGVSPSDNCLWFSSPSFDASLSEIFLALHGGSTLFLADTETIQNQYSFVSWLSQCNINVATIPPAYLTTIPVVPIGMRVLISAGEEMSQTVLSRFHNVRKLFNAYGPSENAVCTTYYEVKDETMPVPVGKPIDNVVVRVVDRNGIVVPRGVAGELHISGPGLTAGYHNLPDITATLFYEEDGKRWYRSGDWVRWNDNGNLEFIGRKDHQLKINGNRVELGDIRAFLQAQPNVLNAVVVYDDFGKDGKKTLVAYLVLSAPDTFSAEDVRRICRNGLPAYMVPDHFLFVNEIPLNANGKVDTRLLPAPNELPSIIVVPITKEEQLLARLYVECLQVEELGRNANFFLMGGNSLSVIKLISAIYRETNRNLSFSDVYQFPVLQDMAQLLTGMVEAETWNISSELNGWIQATPMQQKIWADMEVLNSESYLMTGIYKLDGIIDTNRFLDAMQAACEAHEALHYRFRVGDQGLEFAKTGRKPSIAVRDLSKDTDGKSPDSFLHEILLQPVDALEDALYKLVLVKESEHVCYFAFMLHHLIADGWSVQVLLKSVFRNYGQANAVEQNPGYSNYAIELAEVKASSVDKKSIADRQLIKPEAKTSNSSACLKMHFAAETYTRLKSLADVYGVSLLSIISGIQMLSVMQVSGQDKLVVFTPLHGRYNARWQDVIGLFMNVVPLEIETGEGSMLHIFQHIQKQYLHFTDSGNINDYATNWVPSPGDMDVRKATMEIHVDDYAMHVEDEVRRLSGMDVTALYNETTAMVRKFDIEFHYRVGSDAITVECLYDAAAFPEHTVSAYVCRVEQLCSWLSSNIRASVDDMINSMNAHGKDKMQQNQSKKLKEFFKQK